MCYILDPILAILPGTQLYMKKDIHIKIYQYGINMICLLDDEVFLEITKAASMCVIHCLYPVLFIYHCAIFEGTVQQKIVPG